MNRIRYCVCVCVSLCVSVCESMKSKRDCEGDGGSEKKLSIKSPTSLTHSYKITHTHTHTKDDDDPILPGEINDVQAKDNAYTLYKEIVVTRSVTIQGDALLMPLIDCEASVRCFRVTVCRRTHTHTHIHTRVHTDL